MKTYIHTKTVHEIFIAAVLVTVKSCKKSKCPSIDEWINKLVYQYTGILLQTIDTGKNMDKPQIFILYDIDSFLFPGFFHTFVVVPRLLIVVASFLARQGL